LVLNVFLAILVLSIIVIVHEFGHFIIAKANGITVVEFSIGFGPKLIHFRKGETEYCIKALPFGGACTMLGDEFLEMSVIQSEEDNDEELTDEEKEVKKRKLAIENGYDMEKSFASKSVWARIAVIAAGPVFNFLLAFVCAVVIVGSLGYDPCDIDVIKDNSPATEAGLQEGDVITKVNGHKVTFYRDFYFYRAYNADKTLNITFTRDGEKMTTTVTPQHIKQQKYQVGIMMNENCLISSVTKDSPAEKAGLKANDVIKAVDGTAMENSSSVTEAITSSGGSSVTFTVARDGKNVDVTVEPKMVEVESYDTGFVVYGDRVKTSPIGTLKYSVKEVGYSVKTVIQSLGMLFTGKIGFDSLLGPVGTVSTMSEIVEESKADGAFYVFLNLMNLAALISANLGVMNLLPIPALDGGRLVFLIIEALRGKPVKREHEGIVNFIGMILLVILMVVVLFKDIMALF
jgi:regulator of sigma E protease